MITDFPVEIVNDQEYEFIVPSSNVSLSTSCGSISAQNGLATLNTGGEIFQSWNTCNLTINSIVFQLTVLNASENNWGTQYITTPSFTTIVVTVGDSIPVIELPTLSVIVFTPIFTPDVIYSSNPPLPPGINFVDSTITGIPSEVGNTTVIISAINVFTKQFLQLGSYTFTVTAPRSSGLSPSNLAAVIIGSIFGVTLVVFACLAVYWRYKNSRPFNFEVLLSDSILSIEQTVLPKEIKRGYVILDSVLGQGNFGEVHKGTMKTQDNSIATIAVKVLHRNKDDAIVIARISLLEEAAIMAQFDHPRVVRLIGVVTVGNPLLVLMEYCEGGSLENYLKTANLSTANKIEIALGCAEGLAYLASLKYIHRDIASRNVLLDVNHCPKIADFGMSRESRNKDYYTSKGGQLPIRWAAPECLEENKFSEQSDVWSFGILVFEIWTKAEIPYHGWRNEKVWVQVLGGFRLHIPIGCPEEIYAIMTKCWDDYGKRPDFQQLVAQLSNLHELLLAYSIDRSYPQQPGSQNTYHCNSRTAGILKVMPDIQYAVPDVVLNSLASDASKHSIPHSVQQLGVCSANTSSAFSSADDDVCWLI